LWPTERFYLFLEIIPAEWYNYRAKVREEIPDRSSTAEIKISEAQNMKKSVAFLATALLSFSMLFSGCGRE